MAKNNFLVKWREFTTKSTRFSFSTFKAQACFLYGSKVFINALCLLVLNLKAMGNEDGAC